MRFTHAFAASPLCSPSRSVIQTGLMPHRNGGHKFGTAIDNNVKTMPEYFKELSDKLEPAGDGLFLLKGDSREGDVPSRAERT